MNTATPVHQAISATVRDHYGRLLASLARRFSDPAGAEDALAEACARALELWPQQGTPEHPDAWLLTVARNCLLEQQRRAGQQALLRPWLIGAIEDLLRQTQDVRPTVSDDRLQLMFVCAHPAIEPRVHSALMLQLVLGVEVARMAAAFLMAPASLAQRLVRAKAKIRASGIRFELPEDSELPARTGAVIEAIYGAYTRSRSISEESSAETEQLADEALRLAELLVELLPRDPEVLALSALLNYNEARRAARFDHHGRFVPLAQQDTALWDEHLLARAESLLRHAASRSQPGPMQLEAAIQSAHCARRHGGSTPWPAIAAMYAALNQHWPSIGATVGQAVAITECGNALAALDLLRTLEPLQDPGYLAYWAAQAHALSRSGQTQQARSAFQRAAGLASHPAVRAHLLDCASSLD